MIHNNRTAMWAGLFAGICWGIFWIPIRMVESAGLDSPWAMAVFTLVPALFCLPVIWVRRKDYRYGGTGLIGGLLGGIAFALYSASLLYTDVVRAILLFYLMPIWGFLLGWLILGDRMTSTRWLSIGLGFIGMLVVFGSDAGLPLPRNLGDWCGLASGMFWAVGCLLILVDERVHPQTHAANFFTVAALVSVGAALLATTQGIAATPDWDSLGKALLWLIPITLVLILPAGYASIYAPTKLNPGVVGLLFMIEVVVATITAALWAGEVIGPREVAGVALILMAGLLEPMVATMASRRANRTGRA